MGLRFSGRFNVTSAIVIVSVHQEVLIHLSPPLSQHLDRAVCGLYPPDQPTDTGIHGIIQAGLPVLGRHQALRDG